MKRGVKKLILSVPGLGRIALITKALYRLPASSHEYSERLSQLADILSAVQNTASSMQASLTANRNEVDNRVDKLHLQLDNLRQTFELYKVPAANSATQKSKSAPAGTFADDHLLDIFYTNFEDKFRGPEAVIKKRLKEYLPYFKEAKVDFKKNPVLDIGSGRGEMLSLLHENNINSLGLDINIDMVKRSQAKGLKAEQGDAITYLQQAKSQSIGAITGFHIVEHIPFNLLLRMFDSSHRALAPGGFVIFETPNPENITVGSCSFYLDPSHLHPLPPVLLAFALETVGFQNVEIKRLHPIEDADEHGSLPNDIAGSFYGPRDYAVIAYK